MLFQKIIHDHWAKHPNHQRLRNKTLKYLGVSSSIAGGVNYRGGQRTSTAVRRVLEHSKLPTITIFDFKLPERKVACG